MIINLIIIFLALLDVGSFNKAIFIARSSSFLTNLIFLIMQSLIILLLDF